VDPLPARSASFDNDVDHDVSQTWLTLITAGAAVPLSPHDLTLRHLARASAEGVDVRGALAPKRRSPQAA